MKKFILVIIFLFSFSSLAQDEQFQKQIEEIMKAREEMLKSLMDDSVDADTRMDELIKRFMRPGLGFGGPFDQNNSSGDVIGEYDWINSDTHRILKIKVKQIKDHPLDIKIEKGMIKFKGDVESSSGKGKNKSTKKVSFERSFSIPEDVDQNNPEFENASGEFLVKFKKLTVSKTKKVPAPTKKKIEQSVPVTPDSNDITI